MTGLRAIAHPLLASIFVVQGLETFQHPDRVSKAAAPVVGPIAKRVPAVPDDTEQAVRLNGAVQVIAGASLGLGILPRLSALVLAGSLVPTTLAGHRYWEIEDPEERARQRIHFLKNVTMLGGLLVAAADTGDSPSLAWRRQRASRTAHRQVADVQQALSGSVSAAGDRITAVGAATAGQASAAADELAGTIAEAIHTAAGYLAHVSQTVAESAGKVSDQLPGAIQEAADSVKARTRVAAGQAADLAHDVAGRVSDASESAVAAGRRVAHS